MAKKITRAMRCAEACSNIDSAALVIEELRDELQGWRDGMPENFQDGSKAEELDERISELEDIVSGLEEQVEAARGIEWPRMIG